jgi:hypothetical protein
LGKNLAQHKVDDKKIHIQGWGVSKNLPRFRMWKSYKHISIMPKWRKWSKAQWDSSKGGGASWRIIDTQGKRLGR